MASSWQPVLTFWFGELDEHGLCTPETVKRWWQKDPEFDRGLCARFLEEHATVMRGERDAWLGEPRGRLAYIVVLDQFSRNMFRATPRMFEGDERAVEAVLEGLTLGSDRKLGLHERVFFYMPLMHAERLDLQDRAVEIFATLAAAAPPSARAILEGNVKYAHAHRDIVARFGRFPHRNVILGRESSAEEEDFLKQPGSSF